MPAAVALALLMFACGTDADPDASRAVRESADRGQQLDPQTIAALAAEYPRLNREPLPPPQPSADADARPSQATTTGEATFYAQSFEGRRTASGIPFRQNQLVAAHRSYPFGTILRVTHLGSGRSVNVRVVDRGPHGNSAAARRTIIDLSRRAADTLGYVAAGRAKVRVEVLEWGKGIPT